MKNKVKKIIKEAVSEALKQSIKEQWNDEKKYYLSQEEKANTIYENVMQRYYGIEYNQYRPVLLKEVNLDRILKKHGTNGFVCISANRSDYPQEVNDKNTKRLICDIKRSGYSYLPTYGGYRNNETGVMDDFEPSFLVFNYTENGDGDDFENLRNFALQMCGKYEQHSVMIKYPNAAPTWEDKNGNRVSTHSTTTYRKNDPTKEYFTSLQSKEDIEDKEKQYTSKRTGKTKYPISKRFTYDISDTPVENTESVLEFYVNPLPINLLEEQRRKGEIMIWRV